jgi:hypothetical protein
VPPLRNVTTVEETDRWVCGGAFDDQVIAINNICYQYTPDHRADQCGEYLIDLTADASVNFKTITQLPLDTSCTYRVHTKCGYPGAIYGGDTDISGQFDIIYGTQDDLELTADLNQWEFFQSTGQQGALASDVHIGAAHIFQSGTKISDTDFKNCTSKDRNMWLTITRLNNGTPAKRQGNETLA